jgi:hypothetical protein
MRTSQLLLISLAPLTLTQCVVVENPNMPPPGRPPGVATQLPSMTPVPSYGQPLTASAASGAVLIREGARTVFSFRTAMPNVEETKFINEQDQIVVKSRGNHGPATVQLFNSRNGAEQGRVMAYEIRGGQPGWASSMAE